MSSLNNSQSKKQPNKQGKKQLNKQGKKQQSKPQKSKVYYQPPAEIYLSTPGGRVDMDQVRTILDKWGVCVLANYFSPEESDQWFSEITTWLVDLSEGGLTNQHETWDKFNMPYGPRRGMMQSLISHNPTVWHLRELLYPLFQDLWGTSKLYTSMDGATVHPPIYQYPDDWPHIDQTSPDSEIQCVQGQVILTDTTANFRCTPGSHLLHEQILEICQMKGDKGQWCKFTEPQVDEIKKLLPDQKLWQVPIPAPKGSVILWRSNTIHSAKRNEIGDQGWRCVVYVCHRPADQYSTINKKTLVRCATEGRTTNHWGTRMFPLRPGFRYQSKRSDVIEKKTDNCHEVALKWELSEEEGGPSQLLRRLTAQEDWSTSPKRKSEK